MTLLLDTCDIRTCLARRPAGAGGPAWQHATADAPHILPADMNLLERAASGPVRDTAMTDVELTERDDLTVVCERIYRNARRPAKDRIFLAVCVENRRRVRGTPPCWVIVHGTRGTKSWDGRTRQVSALIDDVNGHDDENHLFGWEPVPGQEGWQGNLTGEQLTATVGVL